MAAPEEDEPAWRRFFPEEHLGTGGGSQAQSADEGKKDGKKTSSKPKKTRRKRYDPDADPGKKDYWLTNQENKSMSVKPSKSIHNQQEAALPANIANMKIDMWADAPWSGLLYDKPNFAAMVKLREEFLQKLAKKQGWGWVPTVDPDTGVPSRGKKLSIPADKDYPVETNDNDRRQSAVSHDKDAGPHGKCGVGPAGYIPYELLDHAV